MSNPRITQILEDAIDDYEAEIERLKSITAIVVAHPQWLEEDPQLAELIEQRHEDELNRLRAIESIVKQHPQWLEESPELAELIELASISEEKKQ